MAQMENHLPKSPPAMHRPRGHRHDRISRHLAFMALDDDEWKIVIPESSSSANGTATARSSWGIYAGPDSLRSVRVILTQFRAWALSAVLSRE